MIKKAVIICGGYETRMLPITKSIPKTMLPIVDKPLIQYILEELKASNINEVLFVLDKNKEIVVKHFEKNDVLEEYLIQKNKHQMLQDVKNTNEIVKITITHDDHSGPGYAVNFAKDFVGDEPFLLINSDDFVYNAEKSGIAQILEAYEQIQKPVMSVVKVNPADAYRYGIIDGIEYKESIYKVNDMVEKPAVEDAPSDIAFVYNVVLTPEVFEAIDDYKTSGVPEINIPDLFTPFIKNGEMYACLLDGERYDLGNKLGFIKANVAMYLKRNEFKDELKAFLKDQIEKE